MADGAEVTITTHRSVTEIGAADWDACANNNQKHPDDPFTSFRFLRALEESGSVGQGTGWEPHYLAAHQNEQIIAVMPSFAKRHSQGEYIFDHNWAHAFENAGGDYYPKIQVAAPFTPATGRRFLTRTGFETVGMVALAQGIIQLAAQNQLSSVHVTFCTEAEYIAGAEMGLMQRLGQQFHWENNAYSDFSEFLNALSSRKRKNVRKERMQAQNFGGKIHSLTGENIQPEHWDAFWRFYMDTGSRKWGTPYLTRRFFDCIQETMRDDVLLVLAEREGRYVAGALNFIGSDCLFGRYWGCIEHHPCLHFELCYYRAIDYAIDHGFARVEAGAQGAHKLARGYLPAPTYSLHWIADPGFRRAIEEYLKAERAAIGEEIEVLTEYGPFRNNGGDLAQEID